MKKKNGLPEEAPSDHREFVLWFMETNKAIINRCITKRLIPNRYSHDDVRAYMQERMLDILEKREAKGNPIEEPKIYFRKLIDFWCIEHQRMYGFCYGLPKRPRKPEAEEEISQYGFVYLQTQHQGESESAIDRVTQLGYIDASNTPDIEGLNTEYKVLGEEPDVVSEAWNNLMSMLLPDDKDVLMNMFRYNLTVPQVSKRLNIAVSTAYQRRDRGLRAISGVLSNFIDSEDPSWKVLSDVSELLNEPDLYDEIE